MVFYRKYRPQTLDELIGQNHIKEALKRAFSGENFSHAYLFTGPKGTGKTSTARILAKMVNCTETNPPCNKCETCTSITDGSNLDLIEIDAASNRGIDDIRDLREKIKLSPTSSKKKVYIIDEAHMLTTEAFNALLKTLEEPPSHALFILATTEPHKIPATILSRVQRFDFKTATDAEIIENLKRVVEAEKIKVDEEALKLIAKKGEGSFRDSLKILDQLASSNQEINKVVVEENLKSGVLEDNLSLLNALSQKDIKKALEIVSEALQKGVNIKEFTLSLIDILRTSLLLKHSDRIETSVEISELSKKFKSEDLTKTLNLLLGSLEKIKYSAIASLPLEIALVESCAANQKMNIPEVVVQRTVEVVQTPQPQVQPIIVSTSSTDDDVVYDSAGLQTVLDKWTYILETVKPYNYSLEALLKQAKVVSVEEHVVSLEVPYSFHQRILEAPKSRSMLESIFADVLGRDVKIICVLSQRPLKIEELANVEVAADDEIIRVASEIFNS